MGKDIKGVMRGKCNLCDECDEYMPPRESGARCDYCNHTPTQHVKIIKLGACGCGECEEYMSEKSNCYTKCGYCACPAIKHKGAEQLRKTPQASPRPSAGPTMTTAPNASLPATDPSRTCKFPGCSKGRFCENGKYYEFCGRTCGRKYDSMQAGAGTTSSSPNGGGSIPYTSIPPTAGGGVGQAAVTSNLCTNCRSSTRNRGFSWCQACYTSTKSVPPSSSSGSTCDSS